MKRVNKSASPLKLAALVANNASADWDKVRESKARYAEIKQTLVADQGGLCAYCEIRLLPTAEPPKVPDFRVEHFHPKSPHLPPPNWAADWSNLLGTCHGGSQRDVVDSSRFSAPDCCCDVPKANKNLVGAILNPATDVPSYPPLYKFSSAGEISVDDLQCPSSLRNQAKATITELMLDSARLNRLRAEVIAAIQDAISALGGPSQEVLEELAEAMFSSGSAWPEFFSCIRFYLGSAAERRLQALGH